MKNQYKYRKLAVNSEIMNIGEETLVSFGKP